MSGPTRQPYLVEEDILIVELYSRTPLSEIRTSNPEIVRLSEFLTEHGRPRTPSAIKFKMENLKSVDKSYLDGGRRKGMENISRQSGQVWNRFYECGFADLDAEAERARRNIESNTFGTVSFGEYFIDDPKLDGKTAERAVEVRLNQDVFRSRVLASYENRCCVTGLGIPALLRASHIKPWRDCEGDLSWQRMDVRNGLCLNALHDLAFDKGYMGIDEDMRVMFSPSIRDRYDEEPLSKLFLPYEGVRIDGIARIPAGEEYLSYHRKMLFIES